MGDYQVTCLRGLFKWSDQLYVEDGYGQLDSVSEALRPLLDRYISMSLHFEPPGDSAKGSLGCCMRGDLCPTHATHPDLMLSFQGTGILRTDGGVNPKWWLDPPLGGTTMIVPTEVMPGHYGRLMAHTL